MLFIKSNEIHIENLEKKVEMNATRKKKKDFFLPFLHPFPRDED
jgi:hypothetical protein